MTRVVITSKIDAVKAMGHVLNVCEKYIQGKSPEALKHLEIAREKLKIFTEVEAKMIGYSVKDAIYKANFSDVPENMGELVRKLLLRALAIEEGIAAFFPSEADKHYELALETILIYKSNERSLFDGQIKIFDGETAAIVLEEILGTIEPLKGGNRIANILFGDLSNAVRLIKEGQTPSNTFAGGTEALTGDFSSVPGKHGKFVQLSICIAYNIMIELSMETYSNAMLNYDGFLIARKNHSQIQH